MQSIIFWIFISVFIVSLVSLVGVFLLSLDEKRLKKILIYLVSLSAGSLFGDAFFHLLPEAAGKNGLDLRISLYLLIGFITCFVLEKFIHWRHCHIVAGKDHPHPFSSLILFSDGVHNFIDGMIIGASYLASVPLGISTTLAVISHEIPQEIGDFASLIYGGFGKAKAIFLNFLSALTAFLGAALILILRNHYGELIDFLIPFAAGNFIYIAGSDLIPELHKEVKAKNSLFQLICFIIGLLLMYVLIE